MLIKKKSNDHMVEVMNIIDLMNLNLDEVLGRYQEGEEQQDPEKFKKSELVFLSGEALPRCWTDPHYRDSELTR
ncbi:MAG: acetyltransferase [Gammaproteobacteria bacterium]|nr:acetyltransferase [Gammaproteobacteria bacterium]MCW9030453.1 acetyltransferase [Gammaproteobacteria bacterium]